MDPDHRDDLFISCHDLKNLSTGFTDGEFPLRQRKQFAGKTIGKTAADSDDISEIHEDTPLETANVFKSYFVEPPQSCSAVLEFESCDEEGFPVISEGLLLYEVLDLAKENDWCTIARAKQTSSTCGRGGVGKNTAPIVLALRKK